MLTLSLKDGWSVYNKFSVSFLLLWRQAAGNTSTSDYASNQGARLKCSQVKKMITKAPPVLIQVSSTHKQQPVNNTVTHKSPNSYFHRQWALKWCMFISCWMWRALHWCAYLLFLPLALFCLPLPLSLSSHHSPRLPVAVSLFISPSVTNLHHLPVSNFPFSPPRLYSLAVALCLRLFFFPSVPTVSRWHSPLFLPPLCLC